MLVQRPPAGLSGRVGNRPGDGGDKLGSAPVGLPGPAGLER